MEMVEFDREFVERTKWIIENTSCKYEITLLLNCMLALVALPTERTKSKGDADFQNRCVSKLKEMKVIEKESTDDQTFRTVKNALSHMYVEPVNQGKAITHIKIYDKFPGRNQFHTKLVFNVQQLKEFALFVADQHLERFTDKTISS